MLSKDIGIDLGTANVLIYVKGQGIVINEPSVVAIETESKKVLSVGEEAHQMLGRTPGKVRSIRPLKDGVIADFELTEAMLNNFIKKIKVKGVFTRPRILICCPSNITQVERNAIREVAESAGAKKVYVEEEPKVAAVGAGLDISAPSASMVIDIGGGTTDIAVISLGGSVVSTSIKIAGDKFDEYVSRYIKKKYNLAIGERTAEELKVNVGCVYPKIQDVEMDVRGRDLATGLPTTVTIHSSEMLEALQEPALMIVDAVHSVLERTPPELAADIYDRGILMTGGGSLLSGLDELIHEKSGINAVIADDPLTAVAIGTGKFIEYQHGDGQEQKRNR